MVTLKDAGEFIKKLPKAEHTATEWQTAIQALLLAVRGGPTMLAGARPLILAGLNEERVQYCRMEKLIRILQVPVWIATIGLAALSAVFSYRSWDTAAKNYQFQQKNHRPVLLLKDVTLKTPASGRPIIAFRVENAGSAPMQELTTDVISFDDASSAARLLLTVENLSGFAVGAGSSASVELRNAPIYSAIVLCSKFSDADGGNYNEQLFYNYRPPEFTATDRETTKKLQAAKPCEKPRS